MQVEIIRVGRKGKRATGIATGLQTIGTMCNALTNGFKVIGVGKESVTRNDRWASLID